MSTSRHFLLRTTLLADCLSTAACQRRRCLAEDCRRWCWVAGTYRQLPEYGPGLFPLYKNPRGWWLFHDKRDHRWMLSNDFPKLAEDLALISKLAGGQTADSAIVPSVKAHAVSCRDSLSHLHA